MTFKVYNEIIYKKFLKNSALEQGFIKDSVLHGRQKNGGLLIMATKAYYPLSEIGAGKVGFSKTRSIIEAAFYGNNVVKVNTLKEAYELAKNSPGTIVTDMPVYRGEEFGLEKDAKVLLFNDGAVTGRYAAARRIKGEPGVDAAKLDKVTMDAVYETRWKTMYHAEVFVGLDPEFMVKAHLLIPEGEENIMLDQAERRGIEKGIRLMQERMLLACENGTPIELPDGRAYFIKSDMQNLHHIFSDLEADAE